MSVDQISGIEQKAAQLCFGSISFSVQPVSRPRKRRKITPGTGGLIVFEGPDGVGKTTLSKALARYLNDHGFDCLWSSFPGREDGTLGRIVYDIHHSVGQDGGIQEIHPAALQQLHVAAHVHEIATKLLPAIKAGKLVILDRFWWSTWVYGRIAGLAIQTLKRILAPEHEHWSGKRPYAIMLLSRMSTGIDTETHQSLIKEYAELTSQQQAKKSYIYNVQNDRDIDETLRNIILEIGFDFKSNRTKVSPKSEPAQLELMSANQPNSARGVLAVKRKKETPYIDCLGSATPTIVLNTYWRFAAERQNIFFHRLAGRQGPWTDDLILQEHKFTNAYRASDRVSQYLIGRVIYEGSQEAAEVFFRIILFKIFNRIETWELLKQRFGVISYREYSFKRYDAVLSQAMEKGQRIYSAAYIMPSGGAAAGADRKHSMHLRLLERMMSDSLPARLADAPSMAKAFALLRAYPTIGDFLAYQYVTDLNYSTIIDFDEMSFVMPGPGARDGIRKCFSDLGGLTESKIIELVAETQKEAFRSLGISFQNLWGRDLQLIDCQNLFCEVDKYSRVKHPEFTGHTGRTKIKQKFHADPMTLRLMYPPKWGINERIPSEVRYVPSL